MGQQADKAQPGDSFSRILNIVIKIWGGETSARRIFFQLTEEQEYRKTARQLIRIQTQHPRFRKPQDYML
jgi:hypothetical protein